MSDKLFRITPEGEFTPIDNDYEAIKDALDDRSFTFAYVHPEVGFYLDDEGMLNSSKLNFVASFLAGRVLYGTVVMTKGDTDDEGDTLAPREEVVVYAESIAHSWRHVVEDAERLGQDVLPVSNDATLPPPEIKMFSSHDEFLAYLEGRTP